MTGDSERSQSLESSFRRSVCILIIGAILISFLWFWFSTRPVRPGFTVTHINNISTVGETALCSGEILEYEGDVWVKGPGVFDLDASVWRETPPATVLYSDSRRMVFSEAREFPISDGWRIPETYIDAECGAEMEWEPGEYSRVYSVITASRNTEPSIISIPFTIREGCK